MMSASAKTRLWHLWCGWISGRDRRLTAHLARLVLWLLVPVWIVLCSLRKAQMWLCPRKRVRAAVISIGNIAVGGVGKTPCAIALAQELAAQSFRVAILLRGYGSLAEKAPLPRLVTASDTFASVGDEAMLYRRKLPDSIPIVVGKNRYKAANMAIAKGCNLLILDDGLQQRYVQPDLSLVLLDARHPFGYGYLLPRGLLREHPESLSRAHYIILSRCDQVPDIDAVIDTVRDYSEAPLIQAVTRFAGLFTPEGAPISLPSGTSIGFITAIGEPSQCAHMLKNAGFSLACEEAWCDHVSIPAAALRDFAVKSKVCGATCLVTTEKDLVRLPALQLSLPLYWAAASFELTSQLNFATAFFKSGPGSHAFCTSRTGGVV